MSCVALYGTLHWGAMHIKWLHNPPHIEQVCCWLLWQRCVLAHVARVKGPSACTITITKDQIFWHRPKTWLVYLRKQWFQQWYPVQWHAEILNTKWPPLPASFPHKIIIMYPPAWVTTLSSPPWPEDRDYTSPEIASGTISEYIPWRVLREERKSFIFTQQTFTQKHSCLSLFSMRWWAECIM